MSELQQSVDRLARVTAQRWTLAAVAVAAAVAASAVTAAASGDEVGLLVVLLLGVATVAVIRPDSHAALLVEVVVIGQWLAGTDDVIDPAVVAVAALLFVFHAIVALMAVTPSSAVVDRVLLWRWLHRSAYVLVATGAMWLAVVVIEDRRAPGSAQLTFLAFVALAACTLAIRSLSARPAGRHRS